MSYTIKVSAVLGVWYVLDGNRRIVETVRTQQEAREIAAKLNHKQMRGAK